MPAKSCSRDHYLSSFNSSSGFTWFFFVAMSERGSDVEGEPKSLVGQITDDLAAVKSITDAILLALLEGISRQTHGSRGCRIS